MFDFDTDSSIARIGVLATVALLLVSGAVMAAPTVDTETTDTTETSDLRDGDTVADFNASDTDQIRTLSFSVTSSMEPGVKAVDPDTGLTIRSWTNDSEAITYDTSASGTHYYDFNVNESALNNMPIASGQNKTVTLRLIGNTSADDPQTTNVTVYLDGVPGRTVRYVGADAESLSLGTDGFSVAGFNFSVDPNAEIDSSSVAINGSDSTVTYHLADSEAADRFDEAVASEAESGDWLLTQQLFIDSTAYKVYYQEAPDDVADGATYGVYKPGASDVVVHTGDDFADADSIDVRMVGNNAYGILTRIQAFGLEGLTGGVGMAVGGGMLVGALPLVASRRSAA